MPDKLRVLFLYSPPEALRQHLAAGLGDVPVELEYASADHPLDDHHFLKLAARADVLVGWKPTAEFLVRAERARLFQLPWAGATPLIAAFREGNLERAARGLPPLLLANNHGVAMATAQHTVAMLLALTNQLLPHHGWLAAGRWRLGDSAARTVPLRPDVTVGLLGYGAINQRVHQLLAPFGVRFITLRRGQGTAASATSGQPGLDRTYGPAELHEFLAASHVLIIALPHTPETEGLLGAEELALLGASRPRQVPAGGTVGPGAAGQPDSRGKTGLPLDTAAADPVDSQRPLGGLPLLVNVARGPVVDEAALYAALRQGTLAGAALDVWYDYQPQPDAQGRCYPWVDPVVHPFHELPNVLLSPHRAASPLDDLERWGPVSDNLRRLAQGQPPHSVVDIDAGY